MTFPVDDCTPIGNCQAMQWDASSTTVLLLVTQPGCLVFLTYLGNYCFHIFSQLLSIASNDISNLLAFHLYLLRHNPDRLAGRGDPHPLGDTVSNLQAVLPQTLTQLLDVLAGTDALFL